MAAEKTKEELEQEEAGIKEAYIRAAKAAQTDAGGYRGRTVMGNEPKFGNTFDGVDLSGKEEEFLGWMKGHSGRNLQTNIDSISSEPTPFVREAPSPIIIPGAPRQAASSGQIVGPDGTVYNLVPADKPAAPAKKNIPSGIDIDKLFGF